MLPKTNFPGRSIWGARAGWSSPGRPSRTNEAAGGAAAGSGPPAAARAARTANQANPSIRAHVCRDLPLLANWQLLRMRIHPAQRRCPRPNCRNALGFGWRRGYRTQHQRQRQRQRQPTQPKPPHPQRKTTPRPVSFLPPTHTTTEARSTGSGAHHTHTPRRAAPRACQYRSRSTSCMPW
jgi:hypothetical protein